MKGLDHPIPKELAVQKPETTETTQANGLFKQGLAITTIILLFAYFGNIATYYYFVKWLPSIVTDFGHSASEATKVLGIISVGGVIGSIGMSIVARFVPTRPLMIFCLISAALGVGLFPYFTESLESMKWVGFGAGVFIFAAISGFFGLFATSFPSSLLGSGSGLVLGIGRGGAVLGPMIPGFLFAAGLPLSQVALIMATGSLIAGIGLIFLKHR
jgi:cyanate permease